MSTLLTKGAKPETKEKSLSKKSSTVFSTLKSKSSSKASRRTSIEGSTLSQRKAKAEAARVKLEYANREGELIKQKAKLEAKKLIENAEIDAQITNLKAEKEVNAVEAEIKVLQEENDGSESDEHSEAAESVVRERIVQYVTEQNRQFVEGKDTKPQRAHLPADIQQNENIEPQVSFITSESFEPQLNFMSENTVPKVLFQNNVNGHFYDHYDTPGLQRSNTAHVQDNVQTTTSNLDIVSCFTKHRFITERIMTFSEKSETYLGWKSTFKDVMYEIKASPIEELDLLIRYLGKSSSRQVSNIKTSNPGNLKLGLEKAWIRIDTIYGSPEKIESALKSKLSNFQKITYKDKLRLYELSDVLNEINSVMSMPKYAAVFAYFNTSVGINPVIQKLPVGIQNKWRDRAISYKKQSNTVFPPFSFFCTFIQEIASTLNDPGFDFGTGYDADTTMVNRRGAKSQVFVHKTSITSDSSIKPETAINKPRCIIHKAGHSLDECRTFNSKPLKERRELLMKHGLCFRCVNGKHVAKDCKEFIKCGTCNSSLHCTIMHDTNFVKSTNRHDGENHGGETHYIDFKCTEICGQKFGGKSCAKFMLAEIFHKHSNHPPMKLYVILDDQSNRSLGRKVLFDTFDPEANCNSYRLSTCNGRETAVGRRSSGFMIRSLDGTVLEMPTLIECDTIPNNRSEIPTPEVARNYPHLTEIADSIPPLDPNSSILLLIGRDVLPAHYVLSQKIGKEDQPYAQLLQLGWAIIGDHV